MAPRGPPIGKFELLKSEKNDEAAKEKVDVVGTKLDTATMELKFARGKVDSASAMIETASALVQPKRLPGGAFGQFLAEKRADFIKQTAGKPISEAQKLAGAAWKALTDAEKAPYQKKSEDATTQYNQDLEAFTAAGGVKTLGAAALRSKKRKAKESKSANKEARAAQKAARIEAGCPKKPLTPCSAYVQDHLKEISEHADVKGKGAVSKKGTELFNALPEAKLSAYKEKYEEEKKKFEEWNKSEAGLLFHAKRNEAAKEEKAAAKAAAKEDKKEKTAAKAAAKEEKAAAKTGSPVKTPDKRGRGASVGAETPAKFIRGPSEQQAADAAMEEKVQEATKAKRRLDASNAEVEMAQKAKRRLDAANAEVEMAQKALRAAQEKQATAVAECLAQCAKAQEVTRGCNGQVRA